MVHNIACQPRVLTPKDSFGMPLPLQLPYIARRGMGRKCHRFGKSVGRMGCMFSLGAQNRQHTLRSNTRLRLLLPCIVMRRKEYTRCPFESSSQGMGYRSAKTVRAQTLCYTYHHHPLVSWWYGCLHRRQKILNIGHCLHQQCSGWEDRGYMPFHSGTNFGDRGHRPSYQWRRRTLVCMPQLDTEMFFR